MHICIVITLAVMLGFLDSEVSLVWDVIINYVNTVVYNKAAETLKIPKFE
jgi:hypothetical protein